MKLLEDLRTLLAGRTAITSIVATNTKTNEKAIRLERLFRNDPFPAIVLNAPDMQGANDLAGFGKEYSGQVLVSCASDVGGKQANDLAAAVVGELEPFVGATASGFVGSITYEGERTGFEPFADGSEKGCYITEVKLWVLYRQS